MQIYKLSDNSGYKMTGLFTENVPVMSLNPNEFQKTFTTIF